MIIESSLKGRHIEFDHPNFNTILVVPHDGVDLHSMTSWLDEDGGLDVTSTILENDDLAIISKPSISAFPFRSRLIHHLVSFNIFPRSGHRDEIILDLFLIYSLSYGS